MIVSAQAKGAVGGGADVPVLVERRNDVALDCLRKALDAPERLTRQLTVRRSAHAGVDAEADGRARAGAEYAAVAGGVEGGAAAN